LDVLHRGLIVEGEIVNAGEGYPSTECWGSLDWERFALWFMGDTEADTTLWVTLRETEGVEWVVAVSHPDLGNLGEVGQLATVEHRVLSPISEGAGRGYFLHSVEAQWIWMGREFTAEDLEPPSPVALSTGEVLGSYRAKFCGRWTSFAVDARVDGRSMSLRHGETGSLDGYTVSHGGYGWFTERQLERWECGGGGLGANIGVLHAQED
jgi:hypothetical protein